MTAISASKAKRLAAKAAKAEAKGISTGNAKGGNKATTDSSNSNTSTPFVQSNNTSTEDLSLERLKVNVARTATGVYTAQERSRDIRIESFSLNYHGRVLIDNAVIELNFGRRYGLIGANGSGR